MAERVTFQIQAKEVLDVIVNFHGLLVNVPGELIQILHYEYLIST